MNDEEILKQTLQNIQGSNSPRIKSLALRIAEALAELQADGTLSPAEHRRLLNRPWHDKASY